MQGPASRPPSLTRDQHCGALCEGLSQSPPAALHKWVTKTQIPLKRKALPQVLLQLSAAPRIPYRVCRCTFQCAFFQIVLYLFFASIFRSVCVFSSSSYKKNNRGGRPPSHDRYAPSQACPWPAATGAAAAAAAAGRWRLPRPQFASGWARIPSLSWQQATERHANTGPASELSPPSAPLLGSAYNPNHGLSDRVNPSRAMHGNSRGGPEDPS